MKALLLNAENLFILFDEAPPRDLKQLSEKQWQALSRSRTKNKPLFKVLALARLIQSHQPDVCLLSEVGGLESLQNFAKHFLDEQFEVALIEGNSDRGIDVGYLVRKASNLGYRLVTNNDFKLKFLYPHERDLLKTEYKSDIKTRPTKFSRDVLELHVTDEDAEVQVVFLLTHLKSKLYRDVFDPRSHSRRQAELEGLIKIYQSVQKKTTAPIFVCGDFNGNAQADRFEEEFQALYEKTDLKDLLQLLDVDPMARSTFFRRWGRGFRGMQLDYVFLSESQSHGLDVSAEILPYSTPTGEPLTAPMNNHQYIRMPSDHFPYLFQFKVKTKL